MAQFDASARMFVRGEGNYLFDTHGKQFFDAISSVWTILHGHCHPEITAAIAEQAQTLDHSTLLGATHPSAEELADRLSDLTHLDRAFFASDGASAVEAALKIALQYWQSNAKPERTRFVHLVDAYHGDTAGAMSVSDIPAFKSRFGAITFETQILDDAFEDGNVAAFIVEPIVQAAAGMRIVPRARYESLKDRSALLIVDEIATGFGRTGTLFAFEQLDLQPDIVCLGKSLTGGALPLSATMVSERIYDAFLGAPDESKQLFHGHSYAGNPIACAAALANLEVLERSRSLERTTELTAILQREVAELKSLPKVRDVRATGLMCGIELDPQRFDSNHSLTPGWSVTNALFERGHFTRPIGNVIQFVPPLTSNEGEIADFCRSLAEVLG
ncbi:MAG: aminotransferase class III-fold pyridoxal phosphate-dependent enzyme [Candidatus Eremiobacteraeota bacterium]|nr:aminotransferase class III-fold pyridoxal phosphate-dependent enzyme [Candidatus Eremiobacteraeota bacterium]MBV9736670.1 aminotransferase class III-fold pyridoxal phosphate-dependent enzyme [Candidatus Eremiobacteraeota bacterium]